jgi:hypothetical protein
MTETRARGRLRWLFGTSEGLTLALFLVARFYNLARDKQGLTAIRELEGERRLLDKEE